MVRGRGRRASCEQVVDPDVDLHAAAQRAETRPRQWDLVCAIAVGGAVGAVARYEVGLALPHGGRQFPWSTVVVNASGCLLIGVLMVVLSALSAPHRLARPLLGVGVLGGYTTFSTFTVDTRRLVAEHEPLLALGYVAVTVVACAGAVWLATAVTARLARRGAAR